MAAPCYALSNGECWECDVSLAAAPDDLAAAPDDLAAAPDDLAAAPDDLAAAPDDLAAAPDDLDASPPDAFDLDALLSSLLVSENIELSDKETLSRCLIACISSESLVLDASLVPALQDMSKQQRQKVRLTI